MYLIGWVQPSMLVVPDVQDVYTPRQNDLLVPLIEVGVSKADQLLFCSQIVIGGPQVHITLNLSKPFLSLPYLNHISFN